MFASQCLETRWLDADEESHKTLVVLHGRGDSMDGFMWMPEHVNLPINYLLVNAPDEYYTGYSWYDLEPNQGPGIIRSRSLLDQLSQEIRDQLPNHTVCFFGFSQGCLMCMEWGLRHAHRWAGYVGVSGFCFSPETLIKELGPHAKDVPFLVTHGRQDEVLPYSRTSSQVGWLNEQGLSLRFESYDKTHTIDPQDELPVIRDFLAGCFKITDP